MHAKKGGERRRDNQFKLRCMKEDSVYLQQLNQVKAVDLKREATTFSQDIRYKEHIGRDGELGKKVKDKYEIKGMHNAHVNKGGSKKFLVKVERFENVKNDAISSQKVNFNR